MIENIKIIKFIIFISIFFDENNFQKNNNLNYQKKHTKKYEKNTYC